MEELIAELKSVSEWLKSLHHLHPTPTHLELNLAKHSVDKAIEVLSTSLVTAAFNARKDAPSP